MVATINQGKKEAVQQSFNMVMTTQNTVFRKFYNGHDHNTPPPTATEMNHIQCGRDRSESCMHFSKKFMCFYSSIAWFTFIFTNIALIPHTIMFFRTC